MTLDFSHDGECHMMQLDHIHEMEDKWPEDLSDSGALTPASNALFEKGDGRLLLADKKTLFHQILFENSVLLVFILTLRGYGWCASGSPLGRTVSDTSLTPERAASGDSPTAVVTAIPFKL